MQEIFDDFADEDAKLPKDKVGEAIRCLGHNPLETEVIFIKYQESNVQFEATLKVWETTYLLTNLTTTPCTNIIFDLSTHLGVLEKCVDSGLVKICDLFICF